MKKEKWRCPIWIQQESHIHSKENHKWTGWSFSPKEKIIEKKTHQLYYICSSDVILRTKTFQPGLRITNGPDYYFYTIYGNFVALKIFLEFFRTENLCYFSLCILVCLNPKDIIGFRRWCVGYCDGMVHCVGYRIVVFWAPGRKRDQGWALYEAKQCRST